MLQVCLNGARLPNGLPEIPVSPADLAAHATAAIAAGAQDIHVHPKNDDGTDTLDPDIVAATLTSIRAVIPGWVRVGVTTGAWTEPDASRRSDLIRRWPVLPDHASVNWHEEGAELVARTLADRGIAIEAGIWSSPSGALQFATSPLHQHVIRVLAEVTDPDPGTVLATATALLAQIAESWSDPVLLHGEDTSTWPVLTLAAHAGLDTRIGLEDTLTQPDGTIPASNADLVRTAVQIIASSHQT
jgi:uncharacterized protein (DUF849 family)